jgi:uroporphyrinogen decarboxylase
MGGLNKMKLKQGRMTGPERLDALFNYLKPDRVPIGSQPESIGFNTVNVGSTIAEAYDDPEKSFQAFLKATEQYGWDQILQCFRHTVLGALDFGGKVRLPKGKYEGSLVVTSYPVNTEKDIETLQMPDPKIAGDIPKAMQFAELQEAYGLPVNFYSRSPFTLAANICGLELFLKWLIKRPELGEHLIQMALDHIFNVLGYWVERFGPDKIFVWMSSPSESNQVISSRHLEKFALPYHIAYHERLKSLGIRRFGFHICGDQNLNLPYLAEASPWIHPSVLSFGHEVDLEIAAKHFPKDIIYGNIEPAVIQFGTPQQIYELCRIGIEMGKQAPGGFILGPGCNIPAMTPPDNLYAMTEAIQDFAWYN